MKSVKKEIKKNHLKAFSMTELVIVLCVIGILMLLVLPNQTGVIEQARALEAQQELRHLHGLEKSNFYRFGKYTSDFKAIGYEPKKTLNEGGQFFYEIEVLEAGTNNFKARARSVSDLDGDGDVNTWEIDHDGVLREVQKD